jgi:hypothetical protein
MKRKADSETIQRQQKELNGLRRYMETAEQHWDLLNEDILGMNPEICFDNLCIALDLYADILLILCRASQISRETPEPVPSG